MPRAAYNPTFRPRGARKLGLGIVTRPVEHPIHRIPLEILQEIFFHCLPEERLPLRDRAPLLLCHVCSRWRNLAMQQSELWDEIWLFEDKDHSTDETNAIFTEVLKLWLDRVGRRHISASIRLCPPPLPERLNPNPSQLCIDPLIQRLLLPYSNMFRALTLDMSTGIELDQFLQMPPGQLEALETLRLHFDSPLDMSSISAFKGLHLLKNLAIEMDSPFSFNEVQILFPWSQLTCLYLGTQLDVETWHTIIRRCPLLQRCALSIQAMARDDRPRHADAIFLHLTHFSLTLSNRAFPSIFDGLFFPALKELRIADHSNGYDCGFPSQNQPIEFYQQFNNLQTLILYQQEITLPDFLRVLSATTSLVKLVIDSNFNYDHLMDALICDPEKETLVPHLEHLLLRVVDKDRPKRKYAVFSCSPFIRMLESRWCLDYSRGAHSVARLKEVALDLDDHRKKDLEEVEEHLLPLIFQGLRVRIRMIGWEEWLEDRPCLFPLEWWNNSVKGGA